MIVKENPYDQDLLNRESGIVTDIDENKLQSAQQNEKLESKVVSVFSSRRASSIVVNKNLEKTKIE